MVRAHPGCCRIAVVESEIWKWHEILFRRTSCRDGGWAVGAWERLQVPSQGSHIAGLHGQRRRQLVLDCEIGTHRVRSVVVKLNAPQSQALGVSDQERTERSARKSCFKGGSSARTCGWAPGKRRVRTNGRHVVGRAEREIEL